jgi:hypothetical protein
MLFAIYLILLIGGMYLVGISFASPVLPALVFVAGILCIAAAVAVPVMVQGGSREGDRTR